jgi:5'-phosphate synthase pdxT subunit
VKSTIGVLALQGAFARHIEMFRSLGARAAEVRESADLAGIDALVIPGGESTTMSRMLVRWGLLEPLRTMVSGGLPVFGTCAGLILMAERLEGSEELPRIGGLDVTVTRNAYGRQVDSFEAALEVGIPGAPEFDGAPVNGVFIRAPRIVHNEVGTKVEVLCRFEGFPVLVRQGNILGAAFHPELTGDTRLHSWFLREFVAPAAVESGTGKQAG